VVIYGTRSPFLFPILLYKLIVPQVSLPTIRVLPIEQCIIGM